MRVPDGYVDWATKGLWLPGGRMPDAELIAAGHDIFTGPFSFPLLTLNRDALAHNISTMAGYAARHGMRLAPHGKTTMAPALYAAQLAAGAWGITLATANQVLVARSLGVPRIVLANELFEPAALRWLAAERERDPDFEFLCWIDSAEGIEAIRAALADVPGDRDFTVLVELGHADGRTGVRTVPDAIALARTASAVPRLSVAGVAGYEGGLPTVDAATDYLAALRDAAIGVADLAAGPVLVSAGGSAYFDAVADVLAADWQPAHTVLLRSGSYVTHDDGFYAEHTPFNRTGEATLRPAFELWARVVSTPEPGLALVAMGKRDAPFDEGLPVPRLLRRNDGSVEDGTALRVTKLNDQHAYLSGPSPRPGDLVAFGISHPCTAFDKWRVIPVVDGDHRVVDLVHTYF